MNPRRLGLAFLCACSFLAPLRAQSKIPPYDLWNSQVLADIKNQSSLQIDLRSSTLPLLDDVYFVSNPSASYFDDTFPYQEQTGQKITIHAYLAVPPLGAGPFPALVVGHGHGGQADPNLAALIATLYGYVVLAIDGPQAGKSTGGPHDSNQAWISVDNGPNRGYLYHYAYAGMRALTVLEALAAQPGNPFKIDASKLGVFGASMGGIFTTYINGIDDRVKAAIVIASAGGWQSSLRDPNGWLYHGIYTGTRDLPYNGSDPLNSIENVDTDPTVITFMDYFDPIRYATSQHAPVLFVIGTHDGYFPLPSANLMQRAVTSSGARPDFEKRLWLLPNAMHGLSTSSSSESVSDLFSIVTPLLQWLDYCFGKRDKPLATPQVSLNDSASGLQFQVTLAETSDRLRNTSASVFISTQVDSTVMPVKDFKEYPASWQSDRYLVQLDKGEKSTSGDVLTVDNAIYFATVTEASQGLKVSSLVYRGSAPIDLSTNFMPRIDQYPGDNIPVPVPPDYKPDAITLASSVPLPADAGYQGLALTNPTSDGMSVKVEARIPDGRLGMAEGLTNPVFMTLPPHSQRIFVAEEWFGPGARSFNGSLALNWSDRRATALAFRGTATPSQLEAIGPLKPAPAPLLLQLAPDQAAGASRRLRIFAAGGQGLVSVTAAYFDSSGNSLATQLVSIPASGTADVTLQAGSPAGAAAWARLDTAGEIAARVEMSGSRDPWSIDAAPAGPALRLIQPHVEWNGTFATHLLALNASAAQRTATFSLHARDGSSLAVDAQRVLPSGSQMNESVESLFGITTGTSAGYGWLEIRTDGPGMPVTALAIDPVSGAAAASPLGTGAAGNWSMPFFVQGAGYWTGLALANTGDVDASVNITAYDPSGGSLGSISTTLGARQSRTQLISQWMPSLAADATGQIIISTTAPLSLLAYFGTGDGAALAAIPFTPLTP